MRYTTRVKNDEQLLVRVTADIKQKIEQAAIADDISISEIVRRAVEFYLNSRNESKTESYKNDILKSLDDEEFRVALLKKLTGE